MYPNIDKPRTFVLVNEQLTINSTDGVQSATLLLTAGTATYFGEGRIGSRDSEPISLILNQEVNISSSNGIIDGLVIDASAGTVNLTANG